MEKDIRWKQRFENFEAALEFLRDAVATDSPSELEKAGIVQSFEFTFELAWKTMKDFLNYKGSDVKYPREVIKEAFHNTIITDGDTWMAMLDSRNLMSHTYRTEDSKYVFKQIVTQYAQAFNQFYKELKEHL